MDQGSEGRSTITPRLAQDIASEAYIFGYPLVLMDVTRQVSTNFPASCDDGAPINQLGQKRTFPDDTFAAVVSPNADTLYTFAFLDLSHEPMVLSVPEMGNRYYLMQMLDAWTNVFASPGTRTTGNRNGDFAIIGPHGRGALPEGVHVIKSPTSMVWIIGRTQTNGKDDYPAVRAIQDQYKLTPLSAWGKNASPPTRQQVDSSLDMKTPPVQAVAEMDPIVFFARLNALMASNPPSGADRKSVGRFASIGIAPGKSFNPAAEFGEITAEAIGTGAREGQAKIIAEGNRPHGKVINGWEFMTNIGRYDTDYLWRALVAMIGLGANLPEDAIYPRATTDADDQPLNGTNRYEITFAKGQLPPVNAFWSITIYDSRQSFIKNPINRFAIGNRDKLNFNDDGSLTLYVQNE